MSAHVPAIVLYSCTFQGTVLQDLKSFIFLYLFFIYYLCEKYYKPITAQHYTANCVST